MNVKNGPAIQVEKIGDSQLTVANSKMDQPSLALNSFRNEPLRIEINQHNNPERVIQPNTTIPFAEKNTVQALKIKTNEDNSREGLTVGHQQTSAITAA